MDNPSSSSSASDLYKTINEQQVQIGTLSVIKSKLSVAETKITALTSEMSKLQQMSSHRRRFYEFRKNTDLAMLEKLRSELHTILANLHLDRIEVLSLQNTIEKFKSDQNQLKSLNQQLLFRLKEKIEQIDTLQKSLDKLCKPVGVHLGVNSDGFVSLLLSDTESNILFANQRPSTCHAETQTEHIMEVVVPVEQNPTEALLVPLVLLGKLVNNIPVTKTQFISGFIGGSLSYEICGHVLPLPLKYRPLDRACLKIKTACTGPKKAKLPSELLPSTAVSHEYNAVVGVETHTQAVSVSHFPL
jgi:hypothetical protein